MKPKTKIPEILMVLIFDFAPTPKWLILELFVSLVKFLPRL